MERIKPKWKTGQEQFARLQAADQANECLFRILDLGQEMLQCGGEVSRVEDSIRRLCLAYGAERVDVFIITSSIVVTIYAHRFGAVTQTRRIVGQKYDLNKLERLNELSRRICAERMSLAEAARELDDICARAQESFGQQILVRCIG